MVNPSDGVLVDPAATLDDGALNIRCLMISMAKQSGCDSGLQILSGIAAIGKKAEQRKIDVFRARGCYYWVSI